MDKHNYIKCMFRRLPNAADTFARKSKLGL